MLELKEAINIATEQLKRAGVVNAENDAKDLYCYMAGIDRTRLMLYWQGVLQDNQIDQFFSLIEKRAARIPLQHILGETEFMGLRFKVNENVLIPRQDTETVVEEALKYAKLDALDLCTGSGCIAISLAKLGKCHVVATDISKEALLIAEANAKLNDVRVKFIESDMFSKLGHKKFDLIVSNPPYIPTIAIPLLDPEVKDHDPRIALDGGREGTDFYKIIAKEAKDHLKKGGTLVLEIGYDQGMLVKEMLENSGYTDIYIKKDLAGNDRVIVARGEK